MAQDSKIVIDVGGTVFMTFKSTLDRLPNSRLAKLSSSDPEYDPELKQYFFDRNPRIFGHILDLYRTGELHIPHCLCGPFVKQEIEFWGLEEGYISDCCWKNYSAFEQDHEKMTLVEHALRKHSVKDNYTREEESRGNASQEKKGGGWARFKLSAWFFLEDPTSSIAARVWAIIFLAIILASVSAQCLFTHPRFRTPLESPRINVTIENNPKIIMFASTEIIPAIWYLDVCCFTALVLETTIRLILCPKKCSFFRSLYNIVDILCILPMTLLLIIEGAHPKFWDYAGWFDIVYFLTFLGFFRILRLLKFARHYEAMSILLLSLRASLRELFLLVMLIGIGMLIFSFLIFFAEFNNVSDFENIPVGFWWAIVTMTTVGYGDKKPVTEWGYLVGAICALTGMLSTGLPIPIIASNFNMYYTYAKHSALLKKRPKIKPPIVDKDELKIREMEITEVYHEKPTQRRNGRHVWGSKTKNITTDHVTKVRRRSRSS